MTEITEILKSRHNGQEDFTVVSQEDLLSTVNQIMGTMSMVLLAIASISLVVGGIGIANIMLVSVRERTREIGVRRAVGARRRDIMTQFLVESVVISILGGQGGGPRPAGEAVGVDRLHRHRLLGLRGRGLGDLAGDARGRSRPRRVAQVRVRGGGPAATRSRTISPRRWRAASLSGGSAMR